MCREHALICIPECLIARQCDSALLQVTLEPLSLEAREEPPISLLLLKMLVLMFLDHLPDWDPPCWKPWVCLPWTVLLKHRKKELEWLDCGPSVSVLFHLHVSFRVVSLVFLGLSTHVLVRISAELL